MKNLILFTSENVYAMLFSSGYIKKINYIGKVSLVIYLFNTI